MNVVHGEGEGWGGGRWWWLFFLHPYIGDIRMPIWLCFFPVGVGGFISGLFISANPVGIEI